jgi:hypothetical protein
MQVGDDVLIIGAPYGISHTLSVGHKATIADEEFFVGGDLILEVCGIQVTPDGASAVKMTEQLNRLNPGDPVIVRVLRAGQIVELRTTVPLP